VVLAIIVKFPNLGSDNHPSENKGICRHEAFSVLTINDFH